MKGFLGKRIAALVAARVTHFNVRLALGLAMLSLLWLCPRPGVAGHWEFTYNSQGADSHIWNDPAYQLNETYPWGEGDPGGSIFLGGNYICAGTVQPIAQWQPSHQGDMPPDRVYARITADAWSIWGDGVSNVSVSNGLGDPAVAAYGEMRARGVHLVQQANPSRSTRVAFPTYTLRASGSTYPAVPGPVAEVYLRAEADTRAVAITRQGARGETQDPVTGTKYGDTTRSYHAQFTSDTGTYTTDIWNWQQFNATLIGGWSEAWDVHGNLVPNVDWSWNPAFSGATMYWNQWSMPFGAQELVSYLHGVFSESHWRGSSGAPTQATLTYRAVDRQDGAVAEARYALTIHDHYETKTEDIVQNFRDNIVMIGDLITNNDVIPQPMTGQVNQGASHTVGVSVNFEWPVSRWKLSSIGVSPSYQYSSYLEIAQTVGPMQVAPGHYTYIERYELVDHHTGTVDEWDEAGHVGEKPFDLKIPKGVGYQLHYPPIEHGGGGAAGNSGG